MEISEQIKKSTIEPGNSFFSFFLHLLTFFTNHLRNIHFTFVEGLSKTHCSHEGRFGVSKGVKCCWSRSLATPKTQFSHTFPPRSVFSQLTSSFHVTCIQCLENQSLGFFLSLVDCLPASHQPANVTLQQNIACSKDRSHHHRHHYYQNSISISSCPS